MNGLALLHGLGCPILLGASRKRTIGALSGEAPADQRLGGSLALAMKGAGQGVQILRVHDVLETVQALRVWRSEEHTSELQSLMRISYAVFCLKKKKIYHTLQLLYNTGI